MRSSSALLCAWKTRRRERNWAWSWASRSMASLEITPRLPTIALLVVEGRSEKWLSNYSVYFVSIPVESRRVFSSFHGH